MKLIKLLTLTLILLNRDVLTADSIALETLSTTLINLATKAIDLQTQFQKSLNKLRPIAPAHKAESDQSNSPAIEQPEKEALSPITLPKVPSIEHDKFYSNLRTAIRYSLKNRKLDTLFNNLSEGPALRAAKYILNDLFFDQKQGKPYSIATHYELIEGTSTQRELSNLQWTYAGYEPINIPLENAIDQILLISRLIDYVITNFKSSSEVSILAIDTFNSIFYTFLGLALSNEKLYPLQPSEVKLNLTILSNTLHEDDVKKIKKALGHLGNTALYYQHAAELLKSTQKFDLYLYNEEFMAGTEETNVTVLTDGVELMIFGIDLPKVVAIASINFSEDDKQLLFNWFIQKALKVPKSVNEEELKNIRYKKNIFAY